MPLFSGIASLLLAFWLLPLFLLRVLFAPALSLHVPCMSLLSAFSLIVCEKKLINTIDPSILEREWTASKGITRCLHSLSTVYCLCMNSAGPNCPLSFFLFLNVSLLSRLCLPFFVVLPTLCPVSLPICKKERKY